MNALHEFVAPFLGLGAESIDLTFAQISLRAVIVFLVALVMVRFSSKRSLAEKTAFDAVLLVILAAVLSRAINGTAAFFASIGAACVLVVVHRAFSWLACRSHAFGRIIKGSPDLVENGKLDWRMMRRNHISQHDLEEDLRLDARVEDISQIRRARVERSGDISFIKN